MSHFRLAMPHQSPSRLEVQLNEDRLAWDEALVGRLWLMAGLDGLYLSELRVAPEAPGQAHRILGDSKPGPYLAVWRDLSLPPQRRTDLRFEMEIPHECALRRDGDLVIEAWMQLAPGQGSTGFRVNFRTPGFTVQAPPNLVRTAKLLALRTGMRIGHVRPEGYRNRALIELVPPPDGHPELHRIDLWLHRESQRIRGSLTIHARRRTTGWLRHAFPGRTKTEIPLDLDAKQLEASLAALDVVLRPLLGAHRDLPIPSPENTEPDPTSLPRPSAPGQSDSKRLPRVRHSPREPEG